MKTTYYVASSLDGYIAKENGDVSWLEQLDISMEDAGYDEFYSSIDALVMGRKTYEMIAGFGQWPYSKKPTWICSSRKVIPIEGCNIQPGRTPEEAYEAAITMGIKHLWLVGGGNLASSFMQRNLLTHISLSLMPIILGGGIKLFSSLSTPKKIIKKSHKLHESGMAQLEYVIKIS